MAVCLKVSRSELLAPFPQFLISKLLGDFRGDEINRRTHTRIHRPSLTEWKRTPPGCQAICGYGLRCPRLWTNALADNNMLADNNALTNNDDTQGTVLFQLRFYSRYAFIPALLSRALSAKNDVREEIHTASFRTRVRSSYTRCSRGREYDCSSVLAKPSRPHDDIAHLHIAAVACGCRSHVLARSLDRPIAALEEPGDIL